MRGILLFFLSMCSMALFAEDTVLAYYQPFDQALVTKHQLKGVCKSQSHLILREDAWRCEADGKIFDPCFANPATKATHLVCPQSPWHDEAMGIDVHEPLNHEGQIALDMSQAYPWAVELADGEWCHAIDTDVHYDGMPIRYRCHSQNSLIGYVQRCKASWSMLKKTPEGVSEVVLKKVWF